jgi:hypothetical protein
VGFGRRSELLAEERIHECRVGLFGFCLLLASVFVWRTFAWRDHFDPGFLVVLGLVLFEAD